MSNFTIDSVGDTLVEEHMEIIADFVRDQLASDFEALVLGGSFGRGEGSICRRDDGALQPLNDYDCWVIVKDDGCIPAREIVAYWEKQCADKTGMRWIDLAVVSRGRLGKSPPTQANYDLKYGAKVVSGNATILELLPAYRAGDIPLTQAQVLLTTRMWCFIGVRPGLILEESGSLSRQDESFALQQLSKALMAVGDSLLILNNAYCSKYAEKAERIELLPGISSRDRCLMAWAYSFKLGRAKEMPAEYSISRLFIESLDMHLKMLERIKSKTPLLKRPLVGRLAGGIKHFLRRGNPSLLRGLLLDVIQRRFLLRLHKCSSVSRVDSLSSLMLWIHSGEWISAASEYAAKVSELRLI